MSNKFYICRHCGNIIGMIKSSGVTPNSVEASGEKHIPVVTVEGDKIKVSVGSKEHPMLAEHFIPDQNNTNKV